MPRFAGQAVALDQAVEVMPRRAGIEPARQAHRAERLRQVLDAGAVELAPQEAIVEARVVRDEDAPGEPLVELVGDLREARRRVDHVLRDAGERLDRARDRHARD